jgi:hypothetical protein
MRDVEPLRTRSGWIVALGIVYVIAGLIALSSVVTALQAQVSASTRIGELKFESGYPSMETVAKLYDEMDFQRGCQAYLWGLPAVSILEWKRAHDAVFKVRNGQFVSYTTFDEKLGILTPNYTTPYAVAFADLSKSGPMAIELPKGLLAGMILDVWQRVLSDLGVVGPDKGQGGKYLILPPGQNDIDAAGFYIVRSASNTVFFGVRLLGDDPQKAVRELLPQLRSYAWSERGHPPETQAVQAGNRKWSGMPPHGMAYWERIAELVQAEPVQERDRLILAQLRFLGIEKGRPFNPDQRQKRILAEAAAVGEAMAKANTSDKRMEPPFWPNSHWKHAAVVSVEQRVPGFDQFDERAAWFYEAFSISKAMLTDTPGVGQRFLAAYQDKTGQWLTGGKTYRLRVPANPPVKQFWSVTVYDEATRQMIVNDARNTDVSSRHPDLRRNTDGSVDVYFGPTAPRGFENNWVETLPGEGYFLYFRFYAPTEPFFDKTWALNDVEEVN